MGILVALRQFNFSRDQRVVGGQRLFLHETESPFVNPLRCGVAGVPLPFHPPADRVTHGLILRCPEVHQQLVPAVVGKLG